MADEVGDAPNTVEQHLIGAAGTRPSESPGASPSCSRRSLGITMRGVAGSRSATMPFSAWLPRRLPSKRGGTCDTADGQRSELAGDLRDNVGAARSRATALARGHEHHVRALRSSPILAARPPLPGGRPQWRPH